VTVTFTAPCPDCDADAAWTETEHARTDFGSPELADDIFIDCPTR